MIIMEVIDFSSSFFPDIPEQDNPINGTEECFVVIKDFQEEYMYSILHIDPSYGEDGITRRCKAYNIEDALNIAKFLASIQETTKIDTSKPQVVEEVNEFKVYAKMLKELRDSRNEKFKDWLIILEQRYEVKTVTGTHKYTIETQEFGTLDYFPKANNLLIRKSNLWKKPGLKWIIRNLLKEK